MNDNPAEQSSSTEQRTEALGKTEHPQNRALGRAGAVMGRRRDEQTAAATGRAVCEDEPSGRRGREPRRGLRVEAARIGRIRDGRMTVTGGADGSRATGAADGLRTTGVDEGPQQRPRRADGRADGGPRPRKDEPVGTGGEEEDEPVATDADGLWRASPAADLARSRTRTAAMGGGAAGSATADAMAGRGEPRRRADSRVHETVGNRSGLTGYRSGPVPV